MRTLNPESIHCTLLQFGNYDKHINGNLHVKTMPYTIVAQCLHGRYEAQVGAEHVWVKPGEFFLVNPFTEVAITHHHRRGWMSSRWIHCSYRYRNYLDVFQFSKLPLGLKGVKAARLNLLLDDIEQSVKEAPRWDAGIRHYELSAKVLTFLWRVATPEPKPHQTLEGTERLQPVFEFVQHNADREISVDEMAACVHLSVPRFFVLFKDSIRMTPKEFVNRVRIDRACRLLCEEGATVGEVSERLGFSSPFNFSRMFKRVRRISPKIYQIANRDERI